ncbi:MULTISPECIES: universal stress protein [Brevibacterium]|uniref:Nucleotide-binding universal stress protein, UspA family n=2 Tax=Brevibacterium antiquum TaxID=234835 RepID=A0A2H1KYH0_9MICO|nr:MULTISPECIES: universal stress protein [Brevibacterium]SMX74107.1 Nucleotide-binding universal stress protein, UspA family [Brevibacterium antiquum]SMY04731.1 Nucleotide-binding universal stress protein, UspA family [Brevibacterium antiquum CNRZ 918]HCG55750.1 universal stress protein [Brevibacterium sp.]
MSHTIIVGVDGSANSQGALQWAIRHAQLTASEIRLVAAYTVPGVNMTQADIVYPADFDTAIKRSVQKLVDDSARTVTDASVPVSTVVSPGDASGALVDNSKNADLAVIGARGRGGFAGRLLGSVALAMPAHAHCPTVVIPSTWPQRPKPERPLSIDPPVRSSGARAATAESGDSGPDFSGEVVAAIDPFETDGPVLRDAAVQARIYGLPLHLVGITAAHVLSPEWMPSEIHLVKMYDEAVTSLEEAVKSLREEFPEVDVQWSIFDAPATEVLISATYSAELMVIGSRGRGGFVSTILGSTSQAVLSHSVCPTRVVRVLRRKPAKKR